MLDERDEDACSAMTNGERRTTGYGSMKQLMLAKQKAEAAQRMRAEKLWLKEEKKRQHDEFLRKAAEKREELEQRSEARRLALLEETNAAIATREMEMSDRQWVMEQERLGRLEAEEARKAAHREEEELRARARENKLAAERAERERQDRERRDERLRMAEELEHQRRLEDRERRRAKQRADELAAERQARREREEEQRVRAKALEEANRQLDEAAWRDTKEYLANEKKKRRESMAYRLREDSDWRKRQEDDEHMNSILEEEDRELEHAAWQDVQRYLEMEQSERRTSLQEYLQYESEQRRLDQFDRSQQATRSNQDDEHDDAEAGAERQEDGAAAAASSERDIAEQWRLAQQRASRRQLDLSPQADGDRREAPGSRSRSDSLKRRFSRKDTPAYFSAPSSAQSDASLPSPPASGAANGARHAARSVDVPHAVAEEAPLAADDDGAEAKAAARKAEAKAAAAAKAAAVASSARTAEELAEQAMAREFEAAEARAALLAAAQARAQAYAVEQARAHSSNRALREPQSAGSCCVIC
mmetsp:Transcript_5014/g.16015  ORF Transcript_5014/g.16015 Transcript_5014/m.16015 type:complete len:534 (+) Transcript_5014:293-1894(+)